METSYKMKDEIKTYTEQRQLKPAGFKEPIKRKYEHRSDYPKPDTNIEGKWHCYSTGVTFYSDGTKKETSTHICCQPSPLKGKERKKAIKDAVENIREFKATEPKCEYGCLVIDGIHHAVKAEPKCECHCHYVLKEWGCDINCKAKEFCPYCGEVKIEVELSDFQLSKTHNCDENNCTTIRHFEKAKTESWEERFDELIEAYGWDGDLAEDGKDKFIKQFISSELDRVRERERDIYNIAIKTTAKVAKQSLREELEREIKVYFKEKGWETTHQTIMGVLEIIKKVG